MPPPQPPGASGWALGGMFFSETVPGGLGAKRSKGNCEEPDPTTVADSLQLPPHVWLDKPGLRQAVNLDAEAFRLLGLRPEPRRPEAQGSAWRPRSWAWPRPRPGLLPHRRTQTMTGLDRAQRALVRRFLPPPRHKQLFWVWAALQAGSMAVNKFFWGSET